MSGATGGGTTKVKSRVSFPVLVERFVVEILALPHPLAVRFRGTLWPGYDSAICSMLICSVHTTGTTTCH